MEASEALPVWVVAWAALALGVVALHARRAGGGVGLALGWVASLALIHWLSAALYLLPWHPGLARGAVAAGFAQSLRGLAAFGLGCLLLAPPLSRRLVAADAVRSPGAAASPPAGRYVAAGVASYLALAPLLAPIPTVAALASTSVNLLLAGLCLACWTAWQRRQRARLAGWIAAALVLPLVTVVSQGFLGYGAMAAMAVLAFVASFYRPRWQALAVGLALGYAGLSLYVTYMRDRGQIRETVWGGAPLEARLERWARTLRELEWFDPTSLAQLERIDGRLNQNLLVGAAVEAIESGSTRPAHGETLWYAALSLIPRAIWPERPVAAGSMGLAGRFTGIKFAAGTSVGLGHVLEFYVNFGTLGVVLGFLAVGAAVGTADRVARDRLVRGDWRGFVAWYLPGLAFLNVGGSLVELAGSSAAAVVVAYLANRLLLSERAVGAARCPVGQARPTPPAAR